MQPDSFVDAELARTRKQSETKSFQITIQFTQVDIQELRGGAEVWYTFTKDAIHGPFKVFKHDGIVTHLENNQEVMIPLCKFPKTLKYWQRV